MDKNEVFSIGEVANVEELNLVLGCRIGKLPTSYLGPPLGASYKSYKVWDVVGERFRKELLTWKR